MEINKLTGLQTVNTENKNQRIVIKETGLKEDSFNKSQEPFDIENAMQTLSEIKDSKGKPKYTDDYTTRTLRTELTKSPEKWEYVNKIANQENVNNSVLRSFVQKKTDSLGSYTDVITAKDRKGNLKYTSSNISRIMTFYSKEDSLKKLVDLADTPLNFENIDCAIKEKDIDLNKLKNKTNEIADKVGDDYEIKFARDLYNKGDYVISANKNPLIKDKEKEDLIKIVTDKNLNTYEMETKSNYVSKDGKKYTIEKVNDYRNHTTSKIRYEYNEKYKTPILTHEIRIVKDKNNKVQKTEYLEPSDVKGVFNIRHIYPNGKTEQISSAKIDSKTGITSIKKNMTSPLGTRTEYLFEDDPQGNRISDYKIVDKNGKVLLNNSTTFEVVSDNKFISSKNGKSYEITADEKSVTVKDMQNPDKTATFKNDYNIRGEKEEMLKVLKQMPGEELFKLSENTRMLVGIKDVLESYSNSQIREIHTGNDLFVILHELGHATDMKDVDFYFPKTTLNNAIFEQEEFKELYKKEKDAFNKAYPDAQRHHISYFINHETHYNGEQGGSRETIAEANALLTTSRTHEVLGIRSQYLQQNFPETIAYLDKKLAEPKGTKQDTSDPYSRYDSNGRKKW